MYLKQHNERMCASICRYGDERPCTPIRGYCDRVMGLVMLMHVDDTFDGVPFSVGVPKKIGCPKYVDRRVLGVQSSLRCL